MMVREGLASVNEYSAQQTTYGKELMDAEEEAKAGRKHVRSHRLSFGLCMTVNTALVDLRLCRRRGAKGR